MNERERKSEQINIRLTPSLRRRFEEAMAAQGHTTTDALIMLITQYCERAESDNAKK